MHEGHAVFFQGFVAGLGYRQERYFFFFFLAWGSSVIAYFRRIWDEFLGHFLWFIGGGLYHRMAGRCFWFS